MLFYSLLLPLVISTPGNSSFPPTFPPFLSPHFSLILLLLSLSNPFLHSSSSFSCPHFYSVFVSALFPNISLYQFSIFFLKNLLNYSSLWILCVRLDLGSAQFGLWLGFSASLTTRYDKDSNFPYWVSSIFVLFLLIFLSLGLWVEVSFCWVQCDEPIFTWLVVIGRCEVLVFLCVLLCCWWCGFDRVGVFMIEFFSDLWDMAVFCCWISAEHLMFAIVWIWFSFRFHEF